MAITVNRQRFSVMGNRRVYLYDLDIGVDGDTFDTGLKIIEAITAMGQGGNVVDASAVSGGTITWNIGGGAENSVLISVTGQ